jgi:DNA primase
LALIPAIALKIQLQNELARLVQFTPEELNQLLAQEVPHKMAGLPEAARSGGIGRAQSDNAAYSDPRDSAETYGSGPSSRGAEFSRGVGARKRQGRQGDGDFRAEAGERVGGAGHAGRGASRRAVAPLARRLLRLLLTHPELVDQMGEQQVEMLARGPHLEMVRDLIVLIQATGARHVGALIQAADPGADLGVLLVSVAEDLMAQEPLPNPQSEWEDAVRRIELDGLKAEQQALISQGLNNLHAQQKYRELSLSITRLMRVIESSKST